MAQTDFYGWNCKMSLGGTIMEAVEASVRETIDIIPDDSSRGTRTRMYTRVNQGLKHYAGQIIMEPTHAEMAVILPLVVGSTSTSSTVLTDTLQDFTLILDNAVKANTYVSRISKMTLSGSPGQKLRLALDVIAKSISTGSGNSISTFDDVTGVPYVFSQASGITLNSVSYQVDKLEFSIDNAIQPTYMFGQTPTDLEPSDRICSLGIQTKYTSTEHALLAAAQAGPIVGTPWVGSLSFTNGSNSMAFAWAAMVAMSQTPVNPQSRNKTRLPLNYQLFGTTSGSTVTKEVVITLV